LSPTKKWQLFDVVADRTETQDLAASHAARVKEMSAAYVTWANALGRRLPGEKGKKSED
jgi:arylsulfatase